jgi:hypothetical protein
MLGDCLVGYTDACAFKDKKSVCYQCPQGQNNRKVFAEGEGGGKG